MSNGNGNGNRNDWNKALEALNTVSKRHKLKIKAEHAKRVLFCLNLKNPFRKVCIKLVEWK